VGSIVQINHEKNLRFIIDIIGEEKYSKDGKKIIFENVVIKIKNIKNGRSRIHPITEYLDKWGSCKTNTKLKYANDVVPFLNYIYFDISKEILPTIDELNYEMAVDYITEKSLGLTRKTVVAIIRSLTHLYYYFAKKKISKNIRIEDFRIEKNWISCTYFDLNILLKFCGENTIPRHDLEHNMIFELLITTMQHTPDIALGVYLQIFGGLRVGEVCNVTHNSLEFIEGGVGGITVYLRNNYLRGDLKRNAYVKKPRKQTIYASGDLLIKLFEYHKKNYSIKGEDALFVNSKGKPMSEGSYRYRFEKVKKCFIENLRHQGSARQVQYATMLDSVKWSTHIGRGIYSNLIAESAENITEIAIKRGDSNLSSSLTYIMKTNKVDQKTDFIIDGLIKEAKKHNNILNI